jgi:hypothetical protein
MQLDELMPRYDAVRTEHRVMPGDIEEVFAAVRETDFLATVSESPAVRLLFGVRTLAERAVGVLTGRPARPAEHSCATGARSRRSSASSFAPSWQRSPARRASPSWAVARACPRGDLGFRGRRSCGCPRVRCSEAGGPASRAAPGVIAEQAQDGGRLGHRTVRASVEAGSCVDPNPTSRPRSGSHSFKRKARIPCHRVKTGTLWKIAFSSCAR